MGVGVVPLVAAAEIGRVWVAPLFALATAGPWLVAAYVRRPLSITAAVLLTVLVWLNATVLLTEDSSGRAIGWASATLASYGIALLVGAAEGVARFRRRSG